LKKAAAKAKSKSAKTADPAFVTPPPRAKKSSPPNSVEGKVARQISFGRNTEHQIHAENDAPKDMKLAEADAILKAIKDSRLCWFGYVWV